MELLSPAGNLEKARVALRYGADAVYIGIPGFSLRAGSEHALDQPGLEMLKSSFPGKKIYGTLNRFVHQRSMSALEDTLRSLRSFPLDALILSDVGLVQPVRSVLPRIDLHLSTQANCTNAAAARVYRDLGFSRIVPARELTLQEIGEIRDSVPEVELEVFVHGAMCMAYSGRCFLSHEMTGRSANQGDCAHSCRWHYAVVEEQRPGEVYPVEQDQDHLALFSSRDLMLLDHLEEIRSAGVSAIKIEGRMKSALYTAITAQAYRRALDLDADAHGDTPGNARTVAARWRRELFNVPHRPYTTGFLFEDSAVHTHAAHSRGSDYRLMGIVGSVLERSPEEAFAKNGSDLMELEVKNTIHRGDVLDLLLPDGTITTINGPDLRDAAGHSVSRVIHGCPAYLAPPAELSDHTVQDGILRGKRVGPGVLNVKKRCPSR